MEATVRELLALVVVKVCNSRFINEYGKLISTDMILQDKNGFVLPALQLSSLPTGAVKQLVNKLGMRIANGEYEIGKNMPMEPELVEENGVSRTVVREAIKVLSGKGLVRTARRYGTHVCDIDDWNLLDPDVIGWHEPSSPMTHRIFVDATNFRILIEPKAAALAAHNATALQKDILRKAADSLTAVESLSSDRLAADFAFHATLLDASNSLMLRQFRGFMHAILSFSYTTGVIALPDDRIDADAHSMVAEAVAVGDSEKAEVGMRKMLEVNISIAGSLEPSDLIN